MRSVIHTAAALAALLLTSGCAAQRTLTITSEPAGAEVRVDDVIVGETPLELPFFHYGRRSVTYYLEGYLTQSFEVDVRPPWYARFPLDVITEVVLPIGWRDDHLVHADLVSGIDQQRLPTLSSVLERAEVLRRAGPTGPRRLPSSELEREDPPGGDLPLDDRTTPQGTDQPPLDDR